jgi:type III pantothenate kinase
MIALEVGNSRVKFGRFSDEPLDTKSSLPTCADFVAVSLDSSTILWGELEGVFQRDIGASGNSNQFVAASVNPRGLARILAEWPQERWPQPRLVQSVGLPIVNLTRFPEKVGTDRLLKAVAANVVRSPGRPVVVVDSGTATTVDWITHHGEFAGGAILAGLGLSAKALHDHTAQLPLIDMRQIQRSPRAVGNETSAALESGLFWSHVGAVRELIHRMTLEQAPNETPPSVLITGGGGELLTQYIEHATYRPTLTLEGLVVASRTLERV